MKKYTKKPLISAASLFAVAALAFGLFMPVFPAMAKSHNNRGADKAEQNGTCPTGAFGHLVAPGWIKKNGNVEIDDDCPLPGGINRKYRATSSPPIVPPVPPPVPPTPPADTTAPVMSNIRVSDVSAVSARITWDTNEASVGRVFYSKNTPVNTATDTVVQSSGLRLHSVMLNGLSPGNRYYVVITSTDMAGNVAKSDQFSFMTDAVLSVDTTPPVISNVFATSTSSTTASIKWTTDEPSTSIVWYSDSLAALSSPFAKMAGNKLLTTSHNVDITGLNASTTHYFTVSSSDGSGNVASQSGGEFMTVVE